MEAKAYPAFGYVIVRNEVKAGEIYSDEMLTDSVFTVDNPATDLTGSISGSRGYYAWTLLSGVHSYTNMNTGVKELHYAGWSNLVDHIQPGTFKLGIEEDGEYICFSPRINKNRTPVMPKLEHFAMADGETRVVPADTKLYLLGGSLQIGDTVFPEMRQLRFKSGDKSVTAIGKVLGYIFKDW